MVIDGTVIGVRDYGQVVLLCVDRGEGRVVPIPLSRPQVEALLADEGCDPAGLIGRSVVHSVNSSPPLGQG